MAQFIFQLEGVLRQRRNLEQQRQRELAAHQARIQEMETELRAMDRDVQGSNSHVRQHHLQGRLDMNYLAAHRRYTLAVQRKATTLLQRMALVQRQVEEARVALGNAARDRKAIEKLREKQFEQWREAAARKEMADLDEVSTQLSYQNLSEEA